MCEYGSCQQAPYTRGYCKKHYYKRRSEGMPKLEPGRYLRTNDPTYLSYWCMRQRCYQPNTNGYDKYGGAGIRVCDRWMQPMPRGFLNFLEDMGTRPEGMTLDRVDNGKDYTPDNCRWATRKSQSNNRRATRTLTHAGRTLPLTQWADEIGITPNTLRARLRRGWSIEKALT